MSQELSLYQALYATEDSFLSVMKKIAYYNLIQHIADNAGRHLKGSNAGAVMFSGSSMMDGVFRNPGDLDVTILPNGPEYDWQKAEKGMSQLGKEIAMTFDCRMFEFGRETAASEGKKWQEIVEKRGIQRFYMTMPISAARVVQALSMPHEYHLSAREETMLEGALDASDQTFSADMMGQIRERREEACVRAGGTKLRDFYIREFCTGPDELRVIEPCILIDSGCRGMVPPLGIVNRDNERLLLNTDHFHSMAYNHPMTEAVQKLSALLSEDPRRKDKFAKHAIDFYVRTFNPRDMVPDPAGFDLKVYRSGNPRFIPMEDPFRSMAILMLPTQPGFAAMVKEGEGDIQLGARRFVERLQGSGVEASITEGLENLGKANVIPVTQTEAQNSLGRKVHRHLAQAAQFVLGNLSPAELEYLQQCAKGVPPSLYTVQQIGAPLHGLNLAIDHTQTQAFISEGIGSYTAATQENKAAAHERK